ncbi:hypothetical protein A2U07_07010 [Fusobacterium necrophorum subsp. funduliforme]|uniref:hypothetical protein n=1 Tax=Fusobacterium necrophorum TaxID=859 RepID=UPI0007890C77|nr:hypothetical protein [Fusobacterium necrophorum]KYM52121.1 hypothetical protein A2U07_07010 [Fusobacterium necrophorum subsp. funduliforme]
MRLFKNVNLEDLERILTEGILPISKTGNDNWEFGKRGDNSKDVVYLFSPKTQVNSFPKSYGIVLLEVEADAKLNALAENDTHRDDYDEYIAGEVKPENIKKVYIPVILKDRVSEILSQEILEKITFVEVAAKYYEGHEKNVANDGILKLFAETTALNTTEYGYFRGKRMVQGLFGMKEEVFDLYEIEYKA